MIKHFMIDLDLHYNIKKDPNIYELNLFNKFKNRNKIKPLFHFSIVNKSFRKMYYKH